MVTAPQLSVGIDLGGTKISAVLMDADGRVLSRRRTATPRGDYAATVGTVAEMARFDGGDGAENGAETGIAMPGSLTRENRIQNANSTWLNGRLFGDDLAAAMERPVRLANDADCFALSEWTDGAAAGAASVFGVILGTGCGGGLIVGGRLAGGPNATGGEWGHVPLPRPDAAERAHPPCWCGRQGCMESFVSGPALEADFARAAGRALSAAEIAASATRGDGEARGALERHAGRVARGLSLVVNIADPEVIVLGGGLSAMDHLYAELPGLIRPHVFADDPVVDIRRPVHGDDSGVRGAARLWREGGGTAFHPPGHPG